VEQRIAANAIITRKQNNDGKIGLFQVVLRVDQIDPQIGNPGFVRLFTKGITEFNRFKHGASHEHAVYWLTRALPRPVFSLKTCRGGKNTFCQQTRRRQAIEHNIRVKRLQSR
jgi:hypothetical protein